MKAFRHGSFWAAFTPEAVVKSLETFDRTTGIVVGICWLAAALMLGVTSYTLAQTRQVRNDLEKALVAEPILPVIERKKLGEAEGKNIVDSLQKRFPTLSFSFRGAMAVSASDGGRFREWLGALDSFDTIAPEIRWDIDRFCVVKCGKASLMEASLVGEKIVLKKSQSDDKK